MWIAPAFPTTPCNAPAPDEVAWVVVWLPSDKASHVTGAPGHGRQIAEKGNRDGQQLRPHDPDHRLTRGIRRVTSAASRCRGNTPLERREALWRNDDGLRRILISSRAATA
jgi:hypothetical protein